MLSDSIKQEIRDRLAKVAAAMPYFRSRPGQRLMIAEVAKAFGRAPKGKAESQSRSSNDGAGFVCINGGTGIGKSLAYCLTGAILARHQEKKLVIASSTVALQEQLIAKDLPLFMNAAGLPSRFELAKGRTRYVCEYKLRKSTDRLKQTGMFEHNSAYEEGTSNPGGKDAHRQILGDLLRAYEAKEWNGDRDGTEGVDDELWSTITMDRHGCLSKRCPHFKTCAQAEARQRFKNADIIVANHDLVLADLLNGGGHLLPKPEDCLYVFDEAHHLPSKAVSSFASSHLIGQSQRMLDRLNGVVATIDHALPTEHKNVAGDLAREVDHVCTNLADAYRYFEGLQQLVPTKDTPRPRLEFEMSLIPDELISIGSNIVSGCIAVTRLLQKASETIADLLEGSPRPALEQLVSEIGVFTGLVENISCTWKLFIDEPEPDNPPIAKWVETMKPRAGAGVDFQIYASPVVAADYLKSTLWDRAAGVAMCSANLTILGDFKDFLKRSGLTDYPETTCVDLPSPFDYGTQGVLIIPPMKATPKDVAKHTEEVLETISDEIDLLRNEGMLVLFTSRKQMEEVYRLLPEKQKALVQMQGAAAKTKMIAEHVARIDSGKASVIFGLESFSEGVDLVGKYCTVLIITKLPFQTPDDPVQKALAEWIERRGGNPFLEISVPDAARKLEQRVGRLIRTESDIGKVLVLDNRLWTTRYGRSMLQGLPPFRVMAMGKEVFV